MYMVSSALFTEWVLHLNSPRKEERKQAALNLLSVVVTCENSPYDQANSIEPLPANLISEIPRLSKRGADDNDPKVREAALLALSCLAERAQTGAWEAAFAPLTKAAKSPILAERLQAAQVLAQSPISPWPAFAVIRKNLHDHDSRVSVYSRIAIEHIAIEQRTKLTDYFLSELDTGGAKALTAARDINVLVPVLWMGSYPQPERLRRMPSVQWTPRDSKNPDSYYDHLQQAEQENNRLMTGIASALKQQSNALNSELVTILVRVAEGTYPLVGRTNRFQIAPKRMPTLTATMNTAINTLGDRNLELTARLREVLRKEPHPLFGR